MKLHGLLQELAKPKGIGSFISARLSPESAQNLHQYIQEIGIKDPVPMENLHCTLMYSRDKELSPPDEFKTVEIDPSSFSFKILGDDQVPVLAFYHPELQNLHDQIKARNQTQWEYPQYIPHITLSYTGQNLPAGAKLYKGSLVFDRSHTEPFEILDEQDWIEIVNDEPVKKTKKPGPPKNLIGKNLKKLGMVENSGLTPQAVADEHRVPVLQILQQLNIGIRYLKKRFNLDDLKAREVALKNLQEHPEYYSRLQHLDGRN